MIWNLLISLGLILYKWEKWNARKDQIKINWKKTQTQKRRKFKNELVTKANRQKCKSCRKRDDQTHVEFAREKDVCLKSGSRLKKKLQLFNKLR